MSKNQVAVIAVVGSTMMDLTAYSNVLPAPGQTVVGDLFTTGFGGKGANQAVMAAICGARVHFIGKLGKDVFGDAIIENFKKTGVDISFVDRSITPTGVAHIWVDGKGENRIVIIPGANHEIDLERAVDAITSIPDLGIVIAQCEIKQSVTIAAFKSAKERGCTTILNPAPFEKLSEELIKLCDWIIPNENEFLQIQGVSPESDAILRSFRPGKNSIVTVGSQGAILINSDGSIDRCKAPQTVPIDTTGAGDCFVGSFAYALAIGENAINAMEFGVKVASNSVTKKGAQSSYPSQAEIKTFS
jgi:ribokinase